jgi:hypothetical protein
MYLESKPSISDEWAASKLQDYRDYKLYDALAGGRNFKGSLYPPRGLPVDVSDTVLKGACFRVTGNEEELKQSTWPEHVIMRKKSMGPPFGEIIRRGTADYYFRWCDFMHSHTWLTLEEIEASTSHAGLDLKGLAPVYGAMMEEMRALELSGQQARLIVWFSDGPRENRARKVTDAYTSVLMPLWGIFDYTKEHLRGKVDELIGDAMVPIHTILSTSRSETELIDCLVRAEIEDLKVERSSTKRLRAAARKLLEFDVRIESKNLYSNV